MFLSETYMTMKKTIAFVCMCVFVPPAFPISGYGAWFNAVYECSQDNRDHKYHDHIFAIEDIHRRQDILLSDPFLIHFAKNDQILIWRALGSEEFTNVKKIKKQQMYIRPQQESWLDVIRRDEEKVDAFLVTKTIDTIFGESESLQRLILLWKKNRMLLSQPVNSKDDEPSSYTQYNCRKVFDSRK